MMINNSTILIIFLILGTFFFYGLYQLAKFQANLPSIKISKEEKK